MDGCQLFCDIFCAYFHSCCLVGVSFGGGRNWLSVLALSSGKAGVAGATIPITSLCSGGETLDGEQPRYLSPSPASSPSPEESTRITYLKMLTLLL